MERIFFVAAKAIICYKEKVLFLMRNKGDGKAKAGLAPHWDLPGGKISEKDKGAEDVIALALRREVEEEVGITSLQIGDIIFTHHVKEYVKYRGVNKERIELILLMFVCNVPSKEIHLGEEHSGAFWLSKRDIRRELKKEPKAKHYFRAALKVLEGII